MAEKPKPSLGELLKRRPERTPVRPLAASVRDASYSSSPTRSPRWHIIADPGYVAACSDAIWLINDGTVCAPATIEPHMRCRRTACRKLFEEADAAAAAKAAGELAS